MNSYFDAMSKYARFAGRTSRPGYWLFVLIYALALFAAAFADNLAGLANSEGQGPLMGLAVLAHLLPGLAALARRLHDANWSGWWLLLLLTGIGGLFLLILTFVRGSEGANRFGPDPYAPVSPTAVSQGDEIKELERIAKLKASGGLTDDEYNAMKARILAKGR